MILCNPHNPVGKIWSREDLARIGELCKKHGVTVISDEIHCDITSPNKGYVPFASVSDVCREISVTCIAPTKCFNIAGMQTAAVMISEPHLRHKIWRALNTDEVAEPNAFAVDTAIAAFEHGGEWLDELREYVFENKRVVSEYLAEHVPEIKTVPSDATYLSWLDCSLLGCGSEEIAHFIREKTGLYITAGAAYGKSGDNFLRFNAACPRVTLMDGLSRLEKAVKMYLNK